MSYFSLLCCGYRNREFSLDVCDGMHLQCSFNALVMHLQCTCDAFQKRDESVNMYEEKERGERDIS